MENINGKTLVFSDHHFGIKGNSPSRHKIGVDVIKSIIAAIRKNKVKNCVFCGDYFHSRSNLSVDTINIAYKCMQALAKECRVILLIGNHDLFNKNTVDVSSVNMFQDIDGVEIVALPCEVAVNSKKALLVPWLSDLSGFARESYDFMFGHFDISSKYLMTSYIEEHSAKAKATSEISDMIDSDDMLASAASVSQSTADSVGDFVEYAKRGGTVFAGHIHKHSEFKSKGRNFIFVGSPYQQTLGDEGNECGYYIIGEDGKYSFHEITGIPVHKRLNVSEIKAVGVDKFDYSCVSGNIVQKVYDAEITAAEEAELTRRITDNSPYEELLSDYAVKLEFGSTSTAEEKSSIELLKKSKLDYIRGYVDSIDENALKSKELDRDKLFTVLERYYLKVTEK